MKISIFTKQAKSDFESLINRIIPAVHSFDPDIGTLTAKQCVFRIYRDVRFSKDKSPYKTNMGAFISKGGRKGGYAGYYLHIDPEVSFIAGGSYMPLPDNLKKIRQEILYSVQELRKYWINHLLKKHLAKSKEINLSGHQKIFQRTFRIWIY